MIGFGLALAFSFTCLGVGLLVGFYLGKERLALKMRELLENPIYRGQFLEKLAADHGVKIVGQDQ